MTTGHRALREPTLVLIAIIAFCSIYASWYPARNGPAIDFYQFWVVGQEMSEGQSGNIYSDFDRERIGQHYLEKARTAGDRSRLRTAQGRSNLDNFSTPFLYTAFSFFSSGDYQRDLLTYRAISLLFLVLSVATLCHLLGYSVVPTLVAITLFTSWFAPSLSDRAVGSVNHFQLGWLVFFLWLSRRFPTTAGHILGGFILAFGAMFKPNTALVIGILMVAWLVSRQQKSSSSRPLASPLVRSPHSYGRVLRSVASVSGQTGSSHCRGFPMVSLPSNWEIIHPRA